MNFIRVTDIFLKRNFIDIEIKSSSGKILEIFCIECPVWYINNFSLSTHDFCIIEVYLFYDSFDAFYFYGITDLKGFTEYDREAS